MRNEIESKQTAFDRVCAWWERDSREKIFPLKIFSRSWKRPSKTTKGEAAPLRIRKIIKFNFALISLPLMPAPGFLRWRTHPEKLENQWNLIYAAQQFSLWRHSRKCAANSALIGSQATVFSRHNFGAPWTESRRISWDFYKNHSKTHLYHILTQPCVDARKGFPRTTWGSTRRVNNSR